MRERVDQFGVAEPEMLRTGQNQIEVNLPGVDDAERAARQVGTTAQLYFYDWEPNVLDEECRTNPELVNGGQTPITGLYNAVKRASECEPQVDGNNTTDGPIYYAFDETSKQPLNGGIPEEDREALGADLADQGLLDTAEILEVPEGVIVTRNEDQRAPEQQESGPVDAWWVLRDNPVLNGTDIRNPEQGFDQQGGGEPIVTMEFTDEGRRAFARDDRRHRPARGGQRGAQRRPAGPHRGLAPLRDPARQRADLHAVHQLPREPGRHRRRDRRADLRRLHDPTRRRTSRTCSRSARCRCGSSSSPARRCRPRSASRRSTRASSPRSPASPIVAIFLIVFYRVLGVIAALALCIYAIYLFALIKLIPITLTLPGIAGLILTIGVAADANIVIFERVKEEIRAGRSISAGIAQGYKKGFSTIVDANIVTLLVAFILFILATAGVKGFAFVLGIGTLVSLFTAVLATQAILLSMRNSRILQSPSALGAGKPRKPITFDFMGASKWFFSASGVILLICGLAIGANGLNFGIDFESGTRITAALERPATVEEVRDAIAAAGFGDAEVQTVENQELGDNVVQISAEQSGRTAEVTDALDEEFGLADEPNVQEIGPTFGETVANSALIAIIASLTVISIYIALRFEWKYAVPVLIALMHDILITAGVYSLVGWEVTTSTVAALLTILGFSFYDTIIVFDRIRENVPRMPSAAFSQIVNRSMSEVIVRSLATSFCTLLPVLALFFFGGETLQDFAFALIVGTLSGTYSSVFIAGPVLTHWKERESVYRARQRRIREAYGFVPAYAVTVGGRAGRRGARAPPAHRPGRPGSVPGRVARGVRGHGRQPRRGARRRSGSRHRARRDGRRTAPGGRAAGTRAGHRRRLRPGWRRGLGFGFGR